MAHDKHAKGGAHAQQDETVLIRGMVGIVDQLCALVEENRPGLLEADTVLPLVGSCFEGIPFKSKPRDHDIVITL